jgi:hypothetical protein
MRPPGTSWPRKGTGDSQVPLRQSGQTTHEGWRYFTWRRVESKGANAVAARRTSSVQWT